MSLRRNFSKKENEYLITDLGAKTMKHSGDSVLISCPKHTDKTPSLSIDIELGIFKCFSCGYSGTLNQLYYDMTGQSASKVLGKESQRLSDFKNIYSENNRLIADIFKKFGADNTIEPLSDEIKILLPPLDLELKDRRVASYLRKRGISIQTAKALNFSFISEGKINSVKRGDRKVMSIQNRLVVPIFDNHKLISAELRDVTGLSSKKVLYPSGSSTNTLYDYESLDINKPIYITEGLMDLAVLRNSDYFANSTSTFGTSITYRKINIMKSFKHIVFIPDNDKPGRKAIADKYEELRDLDIKVEVLEVPSQINDAGDIPKKFISVDNLLKQGWVSKNKYDINDYMFKYNLGIFEDN